MKLSWEKQAFEMLWHMMTVHLNSTLGEEWVVERRDQWREVEVQREKEVKEIR